MIASGSSDKTVRIWDGRKFNTIKIFSGHSSNIFSISWAGDTQRIISASGDVTVRIWDTKTGKTINLLEKHTKIVNKVSLSPFGQFITTCSDDLTIIIWNGQNGKHRKTLKGHKDWIFCVSWSPCGKWLASASADNTIILWNKDTWKSHYILEGHTKEVHSINFSPDNSFLVSRSHDNTIRFWDTNTWQEKAQIPEKVGTHFLPTPIFHPHFPNPPLLATFGEENGEINRTILIWELDLEKLLGKVPQKETRFYRNAKIALVGDSGVGKTGLGLVLADKKWEPTESTHGRHIWSIAKSKEKTGNNIEERELLLWDLAGQPGYRLIHRLHLHDIAVALVLFDARSETDPFAGVEYWARAIDQATEVSGLQAVKILVAARSDRGGVSVSKERLDEVLDRLGFVKFFETSAKAGHGVDEVKNAVLEKIPWDTLPFITTPDIFARIKTFLKKIKEKAMILSGYENLLRMYVKTHPKDKGYDEELRACLRLLEASGLIRQLSFENLVLLQPEMLDGYCAAMALDAWKEPDGLGYIPEDRAVRGDFYMDKKERIPDKVMEKSMLLATVEKAVGRGVAIRQLTSEGMMLVFPSEIRKDLPKYPGDRVLPWHLHLTNR